MSNRLLLTCYWGIGAGLLFPPRRHKHCDVMMATLQEPIDGQLDALAGKHFLVAMATGHNYETINILGYFCRSRQPSSAETHTQSLLCEINTGHFARRLLTSWLRYCHPPQLAAGCPGHTESLKDRVSPTSGHPVNPNSRKRKRRMMTMR